MYVLFCTVFIFISKKKHRDAETLKLAVHLEALSTLNYDPFERGCLVLETATEDGARLSLFALPFFSMLWAKHHC